MEGREKNLQGKEHTRWESLASRRRRRRRRRKISCVLECQRGMPGHVLSIYIPHCIVCVYVICWCYFAFNSCESISWCERVLTRSGSFLKFLFFLSKGSHVFLVYYKLELTKKKKKFHSHGWIDQQLYSSEIFLFIWRTICNLKSLRWRCWAKRGDWRAN
jgi:hypothetical protein